jgi:membrane protein implicated in regulation of membrane protease activity
MAHKTRKNWGQMPWWQKAAVCCSQPTLFYSLMFAFVGLLFLLGAFYLDPDMWTVGLILILISAVMVITYLVLAYRAFGREGRRDESPAVDYVNKDDAANAERGQG